MILITCYEIISYASTRTSFRRYMDTMFHLLKSSLGTGILAMPNAFRHAGWLLGTVGTVAIGFLCTYLVHKLVRKVNYHPTMNVLANSYVVRMILGLVGVRIMQETQSAINDLPRDSRMCP